MQSLQSHPSTLPYLVPLGLICAASSVFTVQFFMRVYLCNGFVLGFLCLLFMLHSHLCISRSRLQLRTPHYIRKAQVQVPLLSMAPKAQCSFTATYHAAITLHEAFRPNRSRRFFWATSVTQCDFPQQSQRSCTAFKVPFLCCNVLGDCGQNHSNSTSIPKCPGVNGVLCVWCIYM